VFGEGQRENVTNSDVFEPANDPESKVVKSNSTLSGSDNNHVLIDVNQGDPNLVGILSPLTIIKHVDLFYLLSSLDLILVLEYQNDVPDDQVAIAGSSHSLSSFVFIKKDSLSVISVASFLNWILLTFHGIVTSQLIARNAVKSDGEFSCYDKLVLVEFVPLKMSVKLMLFQLDFLFEQNWVFFLEIGPVENLKNLFVFYRLR
jgi:hypothetical protein